MPGHVLRARIYTGCSQVTTALWTLLLERCHFFHLGIPGGAR